MPDDRLMDAREDARAAIERYDALDRKQLMDARVLKTHAAALHEALESLVDATERGDLPEEVRERRGAARAALEEFDDPSAFDTPQHARRACYVLRQETNALLSGLVAAGD